MLQFFETSNIHTLFQQAWCKFDVLTFKCDSLTQDQKSFLKCVVFAQATFLGPYSVRLYKVLVRLCFFFLKFSFTDFNDSEPPYCCQTQLPVAQNLKIRSQQPCALHLQLIGYRISDVFVGQWLEWRVDQKTYPSYSKNNLFLHQGCNTCLQYSTSGWTSGGQFVQRKAIVTCKDVLAIFCRLFLHVCVPLSILIHSLNEMETEHPIFWYLLHCNRNAAASGPYEYQTVLASEVCTETWAL